MAEVVQFVPRAEVDAKQNLADFIRLAGERLTAFSEGGAWESDRWQQGKTVAVFATKTAPLSSYSYTPMADPFKQFAKAYIRYIFSHRPVVSVMYSLHALRCLEAALLEVHGEADISHLSQVVLDVSAEKCREFFSNTDVWHKTGLKIQHVCEFCIRHRLVPSFPQWQSPFKKPKILTESLDDGGGKHRSSKLPTHQAMLMVADLFSRADDIESRYFSSIMVLLMVAPSRISEVLALPVECIGWEEDDLGKSQMFIRWHAAKGKGAMKKWVVPAMQGVVEEAVGRLREIGEPARKAAKFAYDHPGRVMAETGLDVLPERSRKERLLPEEVCRIVAIKPDGNIRYKNGALRWSCISPHKWLSKLVISDEVTYGRLADCVAGIYCRSDWPYSDSQKSTLVWDMLCLHRENELHQRFQAKPFSWRIPTTNEVNSRMKVRDRYSLFERFGLKEADGSPIGLTSHQLRHWLSTMSERAGMDDYTLAQWAGRARVSDNRHYDHRTPEEKLKTAQELLYGEKPSVLERFRGKAPVTYQELGVDRLGTAKATLYGMCTHDYAMAPCQKQMECMTCKEHVCVKGDHVTLDRIKQLEEQTQSLLDRAQLAHEDGIFGADRWVDNHKWKLAHVRAMRITLEHPEVADGSLARIPDEHDPSAIERTLRILGDELVPDREPVIEPKIFQALLGYEDA